MLCEGLSFMKGAVRLLITLHALHEFACLDLTRGGMIPPERGQGLPPLSFNERQPLIFNLPYSTVRSITTLQATAIW